MTKVIENISEAFPPVFEVHESMTFDLSKLKQGQRPKAILNFQVIEKTKNFLTLRINGITVKSLIRKF